MSKSYYMIIAGKKYDRAMLELVQAAVERNKDGSIHHVDAESLFEMIQPCNRYTDVKRRTVTYLRENFTWTIGAEAWFGEALFSWEKSISPAPQPTTPKEPKESKMSFDVNEAKKTNPYRKQIRSESVDVYDILDAYEVPYNIGHAIKKLLCLGKRSGGKSIVQDLKEAIWTLERAVEIIEGKTEDSE